MSLPRSLKRFKRAIGQHMTVARKACDVMNFAILASLMVDGPALRKGMQNPLFIL
jgi:hypothetical protein